MNAGARKAAGMAVLMVFMAIYIALLVALADYVPDHWAAQLAFFTVGGVAWTLPLRGLLRWINRPDGSSRDGG